MAGCPGSGVLPSPSWPTLPAGHAQKTSSSHVAVTVITDSERYVRWQGTWLHVVFEADEGCLQVTAATTSKSGFDIRACSESESLPPRAVTLHPI